MVIPLPKGSELMDRMSNLLAAPSLNEIELQRIKNEAESLKTTSTAYYAYMVLGAVASAKADINSVQQNYEAALRCCPADTLPGIRLNYYVSLLRGGSAMQAYKIARALFDTDPGNVDALGALLRVTLAACRFNELQELFVRWQKLGKTVSAQPGNIAISDINAVIDRMKQFQYSDDDLALRQEAAAKVARSHGLTYYMTGISVLSDGTVRHSYGSLISEEKAVDVSFEIADALVSQFDNPMMDVVTFSCFNLTDHHDIKMHFVD